VRLSKIKILGLRSIVAYEQNLMDDWFGEVTPAALVTGINGVGKTTLLNAIAYLWENFGQMLPIKESGKSIQTEFFLECRIVAIQLIDLIPGEQSPTWLFVSNRDEFTDFEKELEGCNYLGFVRNEISYRNYRIRTNNPQWRAQMDQYRNESLVERREFPNIVYITSDDRTMIEPLRAGQLKPLDPEMNWIARYSPKEHDISDLMYRIKAEDPDKFSKILEDINRFLVGKKITGFMDDGKLAVRTDSGLLHNVYRLSTGERQMVLLTAFVSRWLRPGGILLVDEPDLHLHVSATLAMVDALKSLTEDRNAQLIFTSHNPEVWDDFSRPAQRIDLKISGTSTVNAPIDAELSEGDEE
jgi:predicted ATPase